MIEEAEVDVHLSEHEAVLVRELLDHAVRDLSHEIADTDNHAFREMLKTRRDGLRSVLDKLGGHLPDEPR